MKAIASLTTTEVQDLEFIEIVDELQHNWVIWGVEFTYEGKRFYGSLCACNVDPKGFHDSQIEGVEEI